MKLKRKLVPAVAMAVLAVAVTSCGSANTWVRNVNVNYALLIGQLDHNDSAARTAGIRDALGTRASTTTSNANTESVQVGSLTIGDTTLTVTEVESGEQRSTAGATWDATTATNSVATWLAAHADDTWTDADGENAVTGQGINLVVSNNDGMAMAALNANGWVSGTPVFGYDANQDALEVIRDGGDLKGTVSQNAPTQVAAILMLTRNLIDGVSNPTVTGFSSSNPNSTYGYVTQTVNYDSTSKALLADNVAVDSPEDAANWLGEADELIARFEGNITAGNEESERVFLNSYSATDTFLTSSVAPLFVELLPDFNLDSGNSTGAYTIEGDGASDSTIIDSITQSYDAYIINTITTTAAEQYLDKIYSVENTSDVVDKPVIFWNRQPTLADGSVDTAVMADSRFSNIYYVGFDANQGGQIQGEMIVNYIEENLDTFWKY